MDNIALKFVLSERSLTPKISWCAKSDAKAIDEQYAWSQPVECAFGGGSKFTVHICLDSTQPLPAAAAVPPTLTVYSASLLKSNLQKAVRRRAKSAAVVSALQLCLQDPLALVRRLPIIVVEDTLLHPHFAYLVWLMCACTKGFPLSSAHILNILHIVAGMSPPPSPPHTDAKSCSPDLCDVEYRENIGADFFRRHSAMNSKVFLQVLHDMDTQEAQHNVVTQAMALMIRASFGGMKGDMDLLHALANVWVDRYVQDARPDAAEKREQPWFDAVRVWNPDNYSDDSPLFAPALSVLSSPDSSSPIDLLRPEDRLTAAADFHCTAILKDLQRQPEASGHSEDVLRRAMWVHSSSINTRSLLPGTEDYEVDKDAEEERLMYAWSMVEDLVPFLAAKYWRAFQGDARTQALATSQVPPSDAAQPHSALSSPSRKRKRSDKDVGGSCNKVRRITDFFSART